MFRVWLRMLARLLFVLFAVLSLVFFAQRLIPGTPADAVLGPDAPQEQKQLWLSQNGFDRPVSEQYFDFLFAAAQGEFGKKLIDGRPIGPQIMERLPATIKLASGAFTVSILIAFLFGVVSALKVNTRWDKLFAFVALFQVSAPVFISGTLLLWLFAVKWNVVPLTGSAGIESIVLPSLTLGAVLSAVTSRMIRASLLEVLNEDYIRTARAKGLTRFRIYTKHALRNALLPVITVLGLQLAGLLGGTVITEQVFTWPGLGSLLIEAVNQRDYNLVSACVTVLAVIHVTVAALVDLLQRCVDPRTVSI